LISAEPALFDTTSTAWVNQAFRPQWGTCPRDIESLVVTATTASWRSNWAGGMTITSTTPFEVVWPDTKDPQQYAAGTHGISKYMGALSGKVSHTIKIRGFTGGVKFEGIVDIGVTDIRNWGSKNKYNTMENMFRMSLDLVLVSANDMPNTSDCTNMNNVWLLRVSNPHKFNNLNVSKVTDMTWCFGSAVAMSGSSGTRSASLNLSSWDVSKVQVFENMFMQTAIPSTIGISGWKTTSATNMKSMFRGSGTGAAALDLRGWCVNLIPTKPLEFDQFVGGWTTQPVWGTCP
jgi:hypothetical protein